MDPGHTRGSDAAIAYLAAHDDEEIRASTIVLSGPYHGLMITQELSQTEAMSKYEWVGSVPFTTETAAEAAEIHVQFCADGELTNKRDIYTAGTARALGVPLIIGDDHYKFIEDRQVGGASECGR